MAIYSGDQQNVTTVVVNGAHVPMSAATLKTASPAGSVFRFSANFTFHYAGNAEDFRSNTAYVLDATLKAALIAAGAPMVAV